MNTQLTYTTSAIALLIYGIGFMLAPGQLLALYDVQLDLNGLVISRLLGAAFAGCGILNWLARKAEHSQAILMSNFVHFVIGFVLVLWGRMSGAGNELLWLNVGLYLLFAIGFGRLSLIRGRLN
ncbi:MAG: hypothetical protein H6696_14805 [Deferribacteres bacterium]|nr:hypothetical protein [candidate division KSB1 bacterium]MCB9503198.1 hypothetical protein [Deferribacteres bacterium]